MKIKCGIFLFLIVLTSITKAQIVYVDVNPDSCVCGGGSITLDSVVCYLDIDSNGIKDYELVSSWIGLNGGYGSTVVRGLGSNIIAGDSASVNSKRAFALSLGDTINNQHNWITGIATLEYCGFSGFYGYWNITNDGYVGIKFFSGTNALFGWIRLGSVFVGAGSASITLKDYAYYPGTLLAGYGNPNGINQLNEQNQTFVYPNPVSEESKIKLLKMGNKTCKVYGVRGELVSEKNYSSFEDIIFKKNEFPSGMYFYKIISSENILAQGKFIVE